MIKMKKLGLFFVVSALLMVMAMPLRAQSDDMVGVLKRLDVADADQKVLVEQELETIARTMSKTNDDKGKKDLSILFYNYINNSNDTEGNVFLISMFKYIGTVRDLPMLNVYVDNDLYADAAIRAMSEIPEYSEFIYKLVEMKDGNLDHKASYAYAIGRLKMTDLEDLLISWLKGADNYLKLEIYNALMRIQSSEALLVADNGAKKLYKKKDPVLKIGSMKILAKTEREKVMPYLYKALKNKDVKVRRTALDLMKPYADQDVTALVVKKYAKKDVTADIVWWIGELGDKSHFGFVVEQLSSSNPKVVEEAIRVVVKFGIDEGMEMLKTMFGGQYQPVIKESFVTADSNIVPVLKDAVKGDDNKKLCALDILAEKRCVEMQSNVMELLKSDNPEIKDAAYKALKNVVIAQHGEYLRRILESCDEKYVEDVQEAITASMVKARIKIKDNFVQNLNNTPTTVLPRYYKVLLAINTEMSINKLAECYRSGYDKQQALETLMLVNDKEYLPVFKQLADDQKDENHQMLQEKYESLIKL